jgi:hypothetical protein
MQIQNTKYVYRVQLVPLDEDERLRKVKIRWPPHKYKICFMRKEEPSLLYTLSILDLFVA